MASLTLASCNGDYDDWASPQTNSPEEAAAKYGVTFSAGEEADDNMATTKYDSYVKLGKITSSSANNVSYTHLRAHETKANLVCRLMLEKKKKKKKLAVLPICDLKRSAV